MREIARRKKQSRGMYIDGFYKEAIKRHLKTVQVPKRITKPNRQKVKIQVDSEFVRLLDDCAKIAYKEERPVSAVIDEALRLYASDPENYLGEAFEDRHKQQYERVE